VFLDRWIDGLMGYRPCPTAFGDTISRRRDDDGESWHRIQYFVLRIRYPEENVALPSVKEQVEPAAVSGTTTRAQRKIPAILGNTGSDQEGVRLKPVVWPRLKLSAIFSNMGSGQSGARLNNRLIILGDQIDGVTLIEIRRDSVVLKCGKETRSLKMGATLN